MEAGFVASLARPGGNITGLSLFPELNGKRLELLKETVPKLARVAFLGNRVAEGKHCRLTEMEVAAKALGIKLQSLEVRGLDDLESAFARAKRERAEALITTQVDLSLLSNVKCWTSRRRTGCRRCTQMSEFVEAGGLMCYAPTILTFSGAPLTSWTRF